VVNELGSSFRSQSLALSLNENRKSLIRIASVGTPFNLIVSHSVRKLQRCMLGFSEGCPLNWSFSTKEIRAGRSSKSCTSIVGLSMEDVMPDNCDIV